MKPVLVALSMALFALTARAENAAPYEINFGPFVGSGEVSSEGNVLNTNGYELSVERHWLLTPSLALGPVLQISNGFVNTRFGSGSAKTLATYDNRIFASGFRLSHAVGNAKTLAQAVYVSGLVGRGFSKLSVDEPKGADGYKQSLYGNIRGNYVAGELGTFLPLKGAFGLNVAFLGSQYRADQSAATGTYQGDQIIDGSLNLFKGSYAAGGEGLDRSVTMRTYAGKIGVSLGF